MRSYTSRRRVPDFDSSCRVFAPGEHSAFSYTQALKASLLTSAYRATAQVTTREPTQVTRYNRTISGNCSILGTAAYSTFVPASYVNILDQPGRAQTSAAQQTPAACEAGLYGRAKVPGRHRCTAGTAARFASQRSWHPTRCISGMGRDPVVSSTSHSAAIGNPQLVDRVQVPSCQFTLHCTTNRMQPITPCKRGKPRNVPANIKLTAPLSTHAALYLPHHACSSPSAAPELGVPPQSALTGKHPQPSTGPTDVAPRTAATQ
jgi:hypothetical protein